MTKTVYSIAFFLMILGQWFIPGKLIFEQENTLKQGKAYRFKTRPIDPTDPFRGKYIVLRYELNTAKTHLKNWDKETPVYVYLKEDEDGFAQATQVSKTPLQVDQDYVLAKYRGLADSTLRFTLPFNRFYMEESKAYDAERAVWENQRDTLDHDCHALVYIKGKNAVLKDVLIDNIAIQKYVEDLQKTGE